MKHWIKHTHTSFQFFVKKNKILLLLDCQDLKTNKCTEVQLQAH